jgi:type VI secretion system protein ImpE
MGNIMALTTKQLIDAGKVKEALEALSAHLRNKPTDTEARSSLFELLCFAGEFDRAEKHLNLLAGSSETAKMGAILYFTAIHAERQRHEMYKTQSFPTTTAPSKLSGKLNGKPFSEIRDADNDLGARLEVFGAGSYMWVQFAHIKHLTIQEPKRLRDTFWTPAFLKTGSQFQGADMGEVLLPAVYPFSHTFPDESVWLGRQTLWAEDGDTSYPLGQKMLLVDGEEIPFLEVRLLEFDQPEDAASAETEDEPEVNLEA